MQTFTIQVTGDKLIANNIHLAVWMTTDLSIDEIIVTEN